MKGRRLALILISILLIGSGCSILKTTGQSNISNETETIQPVTNEIAIRSYYTALPQLRSFSRKIYNAEFAKKPIVLFFSTGKCETCISIEENIRKNLATFPKGTNVLMVNIENEEEISKKYQVADLPDLILLDANGDIASRMTTTDNEKLKKLILDTL